MNRSALEITVIVLVGVGSMGLLLGYLLYPLFLFIFHRRRNTPLSSIEEVSATLVIPAWKEKELSQKIENTLSLELPRIDLKIVVITDEAAPSVVSPSITWITESVRAGKPASINRAMERVKTPIVVFTDANTLLNTDALAHLLKPFSDASIGAVAGEKRVRTDRTRSVGEELYWRYESGLKRSDAALHSVVGGAGELFAIRTALFEPLPEDCLLDDLELSWQVIRKGYRIAYAPEALATESASVNLKEEEKRKIRMAAGAYQFLDRHRLRDLFAASPVYALQFLFRKWFRWVLAPICLLSLLIGSIVLFLVNPSDDFMHLLTWMLGGCWMLGLLGWGLQRVGIRVGWLEAPFYFLFMHYCQVRGWIRHRLGKQPIAWEKSVRS